MRQATRLFVLIVAVCSFIPLHAQGGCVDSPENPTEILAGLGFAGLAISTLRQRAQARLQKQTSSVPLAE